MGAESMYRDGRRLIVATQTGVGIKVCRRDMR